MRRRFLMLAFLAAFPATATAQSGIRYDLAKARYGLEADYVPAGGSLRVIPTADDRLVIVVLDAENRFRASYRVEVVEEFSDEWFHTRFVAGRTLGPNPQDVGLIYFDDGSPYHELYGLNILVNVGGYFWLDSPSAF